MLSNRVQPAEQAPQETEPAGAVFGVAVGPRDEEADLPRIEAFVVGHAAVGVSLHLANQVAQLVENDPAADDLVVQLVFAQVVGVEEMAEGPVPHVVQEGRHPHERFDVAAAGRVRADLPQAVVGRLDHAACQVHRPQDVLKAGVLGRGIDPPGGLQLVDLAEPLDPGVIDDRLFREPRPRATPGAT